MVNADDEEQHERIMGYLDYLAMYTNPKAVQSVMENRKGKSSNIVKSAQTDEEFEKQIGNLFGRPVKFK